MARTPRATPADLERHPGRCELIDGVIVALPPHGFDHGEAVVEISAPLLLYLRQSGDRGHVCAGKVGFQLDDANVRAPDVAYLGPERAAQLSSRSFARVVPDLVVEVLSPGDTYSEVREQAQMWLAHGVRLVWIADPRTRTVDVHRAGGIVTGRQGDDRIDGDDVLPGFACRAGDFFPT
jgi:Uma2 family endonuclease